MNFNGLSLIVILIKHQGIAGFEMHLLFTHLPGDVLRDTLYGTLSEFGKQLVTCRLVGDGDARARFCPKLAATSLTAFASMDPGMKMPSCPSLSYTASFTGMMVPPYST